MQTYVQPVVPTVTTTHVPVITSPVKVEHVSEHVSEEKHVSPVIV